MTGKSNAFAASPRTSSTKPMGFPYQNVQSWLGVGCDGKSEWAFVGFTESPNLVNDDTRDGYNAFDARVRWDDQVETLRFTQEWGSDFIHFSSRQKALSRIAQASSMLLELNWYGQSRVHFEYTLRGSSKALSAIRDLCAGY